MSNHIEFKREVIRDTFHEIIFAWYFIIKVIEGMQPLVRCFHSRFHHKFRFWLYSPKPAFKKMLPALFGSFSFYQPNMLFYLISVILKIDKDSLLVFRVWHVSSKDHNARIGAYAPKSIPIACYNTL